MDVKELRRLGMDAKMPEPCPPRRVMKFPDIRPGTPRYRRAIELYRLGELSCSAGLWRRGPLTSRKAGDLVKADEKGLLDQIAEIEDGIRRIRRRFKTDPEKLIKKHKKVAEQVRAIYRHAYFVGNKPKKGKFRGIVNPIEVILPRKPRGGMWLSPWGTRGPEWLEWMYQEQFSKSDWTKPVWELDLTGLKIYRVNPEFEDTEPDWEALSEEYDLVFVDPGLFRASLMHWTYGWDVPTYLLLRWSDRLVWNLISTKANLLMR